MRKNMLIIANPIAGQKKIHLALPRLKKLFVENGYEVKVYKTKEKGDATKAVLENFRGCDIIVCAGGDGTLSETITGLMQLEDKPKLGYIPAGTTNDFAQSLGLPPDITNAAKNIIEGQPKLLDIGGINDRFFVYSASFGVFTEASYTATQPMKKSIGHLAYILEGVKELANIRSHHVRLEAGGKVYEDDYIFGSVSNSSSIGGILKLDTSIVDLSDGIFEIMLIKNPKNALELSRIIISLQTKNYDEEVITFLQTSSAALCFEDSTAWSLDGEYYEGNSKIEINNLRHAIIFITC